MQLSSEDVFRCSTLQRLPHIITSAFASSSGDFSALLNISHCGSAVKRHLVSVLCVPHAGNDVPSA